MAAHHKISVDQFGPLFHGTDVAGVGELHQGSAGGPRYSGMKKSYGWNYTTTGLDTAIMYAKDASRLGGGSERMRPGAVPTVYEVTPRRRSETWGPDPDSGPNGFSDGPRNKREALDLAENDSEVSLRFRSPLKVKREVWSEDRAQDITHTVKGPRSIS